MQDEQGKRQQDKDKDKDDQEHDSEGAPLIRKKLPVVLEDKTVSNRGFYLWILGCVLCGLSLIMLAAVLGTSHLYKYQASTKTIYHFGFWTTVGAPASGPSKQTDLGDCTASFSYPMFHVGSTSYCLQWSLVIWFTVAAVIVGGLGIVLYFVKMYASFGCFVAAGAASLIAFALFADLMENKGLAIATSTPPGKYDFGFAFIITGWLLSWGGSALGFYVDQRMT